MCFLIRRPGNGSGAQQARALDARFPEETFSYTDMTTISDYAAWLGTLPADASLIIAGGDGTLNRFLNDTNGMALPEQLYYFATGSGNDFLHDLGLEKGADPVPVAQHCAIAHRDDERKALALPQRHRLRH